MKRNPPQVFLRFFRWYCHPQLQKYIEGDLMELYEERNNDSGKRNADVKFIIDVLLLFRPSIIKPFQRNQALNHFPMFKSYFKIGWRNLLRNKGYSFINIGGLALGMAVAMLISLWVYDELSYNKYHKNYDRIAKVYRNEIRSGEIQTNPVHTTGLGTLLKTEYAAHFSKVVLVRQRVEERVIAFDDKKFNQKGYFMQPDGLAMFSLKMKLGTWRALDDMRSIVISESLAKKIFGNADPLNEIISMDAKWDLKVTGVYEDLPKNSEFNEASYFAPLDLYLDGWSHLNVWDNYNMNIYVQLRPQSEATKISSVIQHAMLPHIDEEKAKMKPELFLLPMGQWHLFSQFKNGVPTTSERMKFVWFCGIIGVFVLILACINFMNLSTARSEKRAKEVGIRKSIGSYRTQLIYQFYSESFLVSFLSFVLSLLLIKLTLPGFNTIADKTMSMPWTYLLFWPACISFIFLTALLAGSYPALYLSSFNPVKVLKGTFKAGRFSSIPRKVLVVVQFTVSVSLIIATIVVYRQIDFAKNRPVGYSREGLISLHSRSPEFKGKFNVLRNEFKKTGAVLEMAESNYSITSTLGWNGGFDWRGKEKDITDPTFNINRVTHEYGKTIGWEFIEGRDFSRDFASDLSGIVINETALKLLGLQNPVGEMLTERRNDENREFKIIGVIKDMVKGSPFEPTDPCLYFLSENDMEWIYLRVNPTISTHEALSKIEKVFSQLITTAPFDYKFADEEYAAKFRSEERIGTLAAIFSSLAILISCSGLFGLVSFVAEQRTKEIGIRKILGASIGNLWRMLTEDFVILALLSSLIAVPIAYYFLHKWLQGYQYRIEISWWIFITAIASTLTIIIFTVSFQAIKAALANPVKSLRSE
jgi:putative ABC transport system permease protein